MSWRRMLTVSFLDKIKFIVPETGAFLQFSLLQSETCPLWELIYL